MYPFNMFSNYFARGSNSRRNNSKPKLSTKPVTREQKWVRGFILVFGTFVFLCFLLADPLLRHLRKNDFQGALPQTGMATVAMVIPPEAHYVGALKQEDGGFINIRFRGGLYKVNNVKQLAQLHENQPVEITYRVGRRGDVAVDSAEPLTPHGSEDRAP